MSKAQTNSTTRASAARPASESPHPIFDAMIMEAMQRVMAGRTTVMIAHRLSTLEVCDARLVIEQGRIVNAVGHIEYAGLPYLDSRVGQVAK